MSRIFSPTLKLATISSYAGTDKILSTSKTLKLNTQRIRHYLWCDADTSKNSRNKIKVIKTRNSAQIQENQRKPKKTKESQRKPKKTKESQRKQAHTYTHEKRSDITWVFRSPFNMYARISGTFSDIRQHKLKQRHGGIKCSKHTWALFLLIDFLTSSSNRVNDWISRFRKWVITVPIIASNNCVLCVCPTTQYETLTFRTIPNEITALSPAKSVQHLL